MTTENNKLRGTWGSVTVTMFKVPAPGEEPGQDFIDMLGTCPYEWAGDDGGITMEIGNTSYEATAGMWVIKMDIMGASQALWCILDEDTGVAWFNSLSTIR